MKLLTHIKWQSGHLIHVVMDNKYGKFNVLIMYSSLFLETMAILKGYNYNKQDMVQNYYDHINVNQKEEIV